MKMGLACEQALGGAMAARREKEGELASSLWNLNSSSNFKAVALRRLSCQISASQREAETNWNVTNIEKHVPWVMTSLLKPIDHLHDTITHLPLSTFLSSN